MDKIKSNLYTGQSTYEAGYQFFVMYLHLTRAEKGQTSDLPF